MPIAEWNVPFLLHSTYGDVSMNDLAGPLYLLDATLCNAGAEVRDTKENVPQADGSLLHRRFFTGYEIRMAMSYWENPTTPACEAVATTMHDLVMGTLRSLNDEDATEIGKLTWTPTGHAERMFTNVHLLERATVTPRDDGLIVVSFTLDTPLPYAQDATETTTSFSDASPTHGLTNGGTAAFYPVWKVYGPTFYWTITNATTGQFITYNADLPGAVGIGGGDYAEIDTFKNTIYLNGNQANLKPGIDIPDSDFFPLVPGANSITVSGDGTFDAPNVDCLWQYAWA